jgi:TctA family transporter
MPDKHLSTQFDAELSGVSTRVLEMGGLVESQVSRSISALVNMEADLAGQVLRDEERVNRMEVEIDRDLSGIIARRQPTARDLRLLIAISKIIANLEHGSEKRQVFTDKVGSLMPTWDEVKQASGAVLRGTGLGAVLGVLPGGGALLAAFAAYTVEKKLGGKNANPPFGQGNIRGVAGPESANNAGAQTSFIPMLTLGIPPNAVMALMVGAMTIHGIIPGPQVMTKSPDLFWGMVASMWIGNLMLLIINLPLIGLWVRLLQVPYRLMFPAILLFCCIGIYSINNNIHFAECIISTYRYW